MKPPGTMTVREAAIAMETSERRILELIAEGKLSTINTSKGKTRPRWAILNESVESFAKPKPLPPRVKVPQHV